jgi:hypothetical protein
MPVGISVVIVRLDSFLQLYRQLCGQGAHAIRARDCGCGAGPGTWVELGIGSACCHVPRPLPGLFEDGEDRHHHRLPSSAAAIQTRAPHGLSSLCTRDEEYWLTKANLVFDILVERVMRQFGRRQYFPLLPRAFQAVPRNVHE